MYRRRTAVAARIGLHARPAGLLAQEAAKSPARVRIAKVVDGAVGEPVDAASVLSLMTLAAGHGDEVELSADGDHARDAVDALVALLEQDLDS
jgi:phosphocarrier protein